MQVDLNPNLSEDEMPLFPLNVVLFPGDILPLHIFEQRYRLMTQFCMDHDRLFGVVLIKSGQEVGEPAEAYLVGTAVKIIEAEHLENGRMNLLTLGQHRFQTVKIRQDLPYLVGQVSTFGTDEIGAQEDAGMLVLKASQLYQTYESLLGELVPEWKPVEEIPTNLYHLSYQIGTRLQISVKAKQQLLETLPINQLLSREIELLEQENQKLRASLSIRSTLEEHKPTEVPLWKGVSLN